MILRPLDLLQEPPARARNGVNVPKIMLCFSAVKKACRRARSKPLPKEWLGSSDRAYQRLSTCVEKSRHARCFRAFAPENRLVGCSARLHHHQRRIGNGQWSSVQLIGLNPTLPNGRTKYRPVFHSFARALQMYGGVPPPRRAAAGAPGAARSPPSAMWQAGRCVESRLGAGHRPGWGERHR